MIKRRPINICQQKRLNAADPLCQKCDEPLWPAREMIIQQFYLKVLTARTGICPGL